MMDSKDANQVAFRRSHSFEFEEKLSRSAMARGAGDSCISGIPAPRRLARFKGFWRNRRRRRRRRNTTFKSKLKVDLCQASYHLRCHKMSRLCESRGGGREITYESIGKVATEIEKTPRKSPSESRRIPRSRGFNPIVFIAKEEASFFSLLLFALLTSSCLFSFSGVHLVSSASLSLGARPMSWPRELLLNLNQEQRHRHIQQQKQQQQQLQMDFMIDEHDKLAETRETLVTNKFSYITSNSNGQAKSMKSNRLNLSHNYNTGDKRQSNAGVPFQRQMLSRRKRRRRRALEQRQQPEVRGLVAFQQNIGDNITNSNNNRDDHDSETSTARGNATELLNQLILEKQQRQLLELKQKYRTNRAISDQAYYTLLVIYLIFIVIGATSNSLICLTVILKPRILSPRNIFIINLAGSDLLLCVFTMPFSFIEISMKMWHMGVTPCKLVAGLQATSIFVSTISITAIALDRYKVIVYPTHQEVPNGTRGFALLLASVWVGALLLSAPLFWFRTVEHYTLPTKYDVIESSIEFCIEAWPFAHGRGIYSVISMIFQYVLPITIVSIVYAKISDKLQKRLIRRQRLTQLECQQKKQLNLIRRTHTMLISVSLVFGLSWLPLNLFNIIGDFTTDLFKGDDQLFRIVFAVCHLIGCSSACSNPILYGFLNENFRKEFHQVYTHHAHRIARRARHFYNKWLRCGRWRQRKFPDGNDEFTITATPSSTSSSSSGSQSSGGRRRSGGGDVNNDSSSSRDSSSSGSEFDEDQESTSASSNSMAGKQLVAAGAGAEGTGLDGNKLQVVVMSAEGGDAAIGQSARSGSNSNLQDQYLAMAETEKRRVSFQAPSINGTNGNGSNSNQTLGRTIRFCLCIAHSSSEEVNSLNGVTGLAGYSPNSVPERRIKFRSSGESGKKRSRRQSDNQLGSVVVTNGVASAPGIEANPGASGGSRNRDKSSRRSKSKSSSSSTRRKSKPTEWQCDCDCHKRRSSLINSVVANVLRRASIQSLAGMDMGGGSGIGVATNRTVNSNNQTLNDCGALSTTTTTTIGKTKHQAQGGRRVWLRLFARKAPTNSNDHPLALTATPDAAAVTSQPQTHVVAATGSVIQDDNNNKPTNCSESVPNLHCAKCKHGSQRQLRRSKRQEQRRDRRRLRRKEKRQEEEKKHIKGQVTSRSANVTVKQGGAIEGLAMGALNLASTSSSGGPTMILSGGASRACPSNLGEKQAGDAIPLTAMGKSAPLVMDAHRKGITGSESIKEIGTVYLSVQQAACAMNNTSSSVLAGSEMSLDMNERSTSVVVLDASSENDLATAIRCRTPEVYCGKPNGALVARCNRGGAAMSADCLHGSSEISVPQQQPSPSQPLQAPVTEMPTNQATEQKDTQQQQDCEPADHKLMSLSTSGSPLSGSPVMSSAASANSILSSSVVTCSCSAESQTSLSSCTHLETTCASCSQSLECDCRFKVCRKDTMMSDTKENKTSESNLITATESSCQNDSSNPNQVVSNSQNPESNTRKQATVMTRMPASSCTTTATSRSSLMSEMACSSQASLQSPTCSGSMISFDNNNNSSHQQQRQQKNNHCPVGDSHLRVDKSSKGKQVVAMELNQQRKLSAASYSGGAISLSEQNQNSSQSMAKMTSDQRALKKSCNGFQETLGGALATSCNKMSNSSGPASAEISKRQQHIIAHSGNGDNNRDNNSELKQASDCNLKRLAGATKTELLAESLTRVTQPKGTATTPLDEATKTGHRQSLG